MKIVNGWKTTCALFLLCATTAIAAPAQIHAGIAGADNSNGPSPECEERVLHYFNGEDGEAPVGTLALDAEGNLYGTAELGDTYYGNVFQLVPGADGIWKEHVVHRLRGSDGATPLAGVTFGPRGGLFGTAFNGGNNSDFGDVFELTLNADDEPKEDVLQYFSGTNGAFPASDPIFDAAGNLYGTTSGGGNQQGCDGYNCGTVFELRPNANGAWSEILLHSFGAGDGQGPYGNLIFDAAGNLYGTTTYGGADSPIASECESGCGIVFMLKPIMDGNWEERVLHRFVGPDGARPYGGLVFDTSGNLYGTTTVGGDLSACNAKGCGTVFELSPNGPGGGWTETVLHNFHGPDGSFPSAGLVFDALGNLYGTTANGGNFNPCRFGCGTVFRLVPGATGKWTYQALYAFDFRHGAGPSGLVFDEPGNLYGVASAGGRTNCNGNSCGVVFEIPATALTGAPLSCLK